MLRASLGMVVVLSCLAAVAQASPNKQRRGRSARGKTSSAIVEAMGELRWGASRKEVTDYLTRLTKETYRTELQATRDPMEKDRLRRQLREEVNSVKESYVQLDGRSTSWDASFLKNEMRHGRGEAMLVRRDDKSQNFYFFRHGRLWKWYKAFDSKTFPFRSFDKFGAMTKKKFGRGQEKSSRAGARTDARRWIEWQNQHTRLRAVDETEFYGFFGLVFESKAALAAVAQGASSQRDRRKPERPSLVDSVTGVGDPTAGDRPDIVDRLTGKRRTRGTTSRSDSRRGGRKDRDQAGDKTEQAPQESRPLAPRLDDNDPLQGIL